MISFSEWDVYFDMGTAMWGLPRPETHVLPIWPRLKRNGKGFSVCVYELLISEQRLVTAASSWMFRTWDWWPRETSCRDSPVPPPVLYPINTLQFWRIVVQQLENPTWVELHCTCVWLFVWWTLSLLLLFWSWFLFCLFRQCMVKLAIAVDHYSKSISKCCLT